MRAAAWAGMRAGTHACRRAGGVSRHGAAPHQRPFSRSSSHCSTCREAENVHRGMQRGSHDAGTRIPATSMQCTFQIRDTPNETRVLQAPCPLSSTSRHEPHHDCAAPAAPARPGDSPTPRGTCSRRRACRTRTAGTRRRAQTRTCGSGFFWRGGGFAGATESRPRFLPTRARCHGRAALQAGRQVRLAAGPRRGVVAIAPRCRRAGASWAQGQRIAGCQHPAWP